MWQNFEYFSGYGFNKSHCMFSMISYQCAWLMTYYEGEWMAAYLDKVSDKKKEGAIATASLLDTRSQNSMSICLVDSGSMMKTTTSLQPLTTIKGLELLLWIKSS